MTVSASNSDEQQVSQQLQHERSTLPLVHLPYELAEETSLYFKPKEAARVLSVSRSFYNLLIPRVCYELESCCRYRALSDFEEWFKTYGQYVRLVDPLLPEIRHIAANLDWLPFVNKATYLRSFLHADSPLNDISKILQCLQQIKSLRIVNLDFDDIPTTWMEVLKMAKAFNELKYISCIDIQFPNYITMPSREHWIKMIEFVDALHPSKRAKLKLTMNFDNSVTTQHVRALAPYLVELNAVANRFQPSIMNETRDILSGNSVSAVDVDIGYAFPRLEYLVMEFCRLHQQLYEFRDVTPIRAPRLRHLSYSPGRCASCHLEQESVRDNGQIWRPEFSNYGHVVVPSYHWPNLVYLSIGVISSERLMNIISLNPQLQSLIVNPSWEPGEDSMQDSTMFSADEFSNDMFKIDKILEQLPHLRTLTIAKLYAIIDADSDSISFERRHKTHIVIGSRMAVTPAAITYILHMQQLTGLRFHQFVFTDIDKTINLLSDCTGSCGARWFEWHPIDWNQELALAIIRRMPKLDQFSARKCPDKYHVVFKDKCKSVFYMY